MNTAVVTDSSCDLASSTLEALEVLAVPLGVRFGEHELRDGRESTAVDCIGRMRETGEVPRLRPPDPDDFAAAYERALDRRASVVSVHVSSRLSETLTHAQEGAKRAGAAGRVRFVDGLAAGSALAEQVRAAARAAAAGRGADEVSAAALRVRDATVMLLAPFDLRWLRKGRRMGTLQAAASTVTARRPLWELREGDLVSVASVPSARRIDRMVRILERRLGETPVRVVIGIAAEDPGAADAAKARLTAGTLRIGEGRVQRIGAFLGARLGPGALTLVAYPEHALIAPPDDVAPPPRGQASSP
ncbi:MAG: DegV family protein [Trueperaceae bacterium]|nr:DegV family protein [Trueperaceae bacterium]